MLRDPSMRPMSLPPSIRLPLAAIAAAVLCAAGPSAARASQEDCFVEVPDGPKKAPAPRRAKHSPQPTLVGPVLEKFAGGAGG